MSTTVFKPEFSEISTHFWTKASRHTCDENDSRCNNEGSGENVMYKEGIDSLHVLLVFILKASQDMTELWQLSQLPRFRQCTSMKETPYFDLLMERFVDNFAPISSLNCGNADSLRAAGELSIFSPLLKHAFMAASALYFGCDMQDWRFVAASNTVYVGVLRHLQRALYHPEQSRSEGVLATVCVVMAYEVRPSMVSWTGGS